MAEIDPKVLSLEQLNQVKEMLQQEVDALQKSHDQLLMAANRFSASKDAIERLFHEAPGTPMLVPLTSSLYVNGKVADPNSLLVDIGTGYMIDMTNEKACAHMQRKIDMLATSTKRISAAMQMKRKQLQIVMMQMNIKFHEHQQRVNATNNANNANAITSGDAGASSSTSVSA
eukprot:c12891_g1_i1.p1 GENE.c12891_g1_i1~~c12891_g1_i1.p1  ORF type:complete len:185 (-),score=62.97 c12891_g1_i1:130-648(-)